MEQYESYLKDHEWPHYIDGAIQGVKTILDATVTTGMPASEFDRLRNFLLIIVNYVMRGQGGQVSEDTGAFKDVKGMPAKQAFTLMCRTNFSSIHHNLLGRAATAAYKKIVEKDEILKALSLTRKSPFFIAGYGSTAVGHHGGPTVHDWLTGIYNNNDLLTPKSGNGMSAAMGKYPVKTEPGDKDRWLVKFEARNSSKGAFAKSKDWVSHVAKVYALATARRKRPVAWLLLPLGSEADQFLDLVAVDVSGAISLAHKQGITDENALTNLLFHSLHLELGGRSIGQTEKDLAQEWRLIRKDLVRPFLALKGSKEISSFVGEEFLDLETVAELEHNSADWVTDAIASREFDEDELEQTGLQVDEADRDDKALADASQGFELGDLESIQLPDHETGSHEHDGVLGNGYELETVRPQEL